MNRRRFAQAAIGTALIALTAITTGGAQAEVPVHRDTPAAASAAMDQETYLATMRGLLAGKPGAAQDDAAIIASGKSICADIDAGANSATFEKQIKDYSLDRAVYRTIIRSSILTFCPEDSVQIIR